MKDYHVHYYLDSCAADDMTFSSIEKRCAELDIDEITVLKHYSAAMPNGKPDWICWHAVKPEQWERYLSEYSAYKPYKLKIHSGVETELCNENGDINIPLSEQGRVDMCALSVHYMIDLDCLKMDFMLYPDLNFCPEHNNDEGKRQLAEWREKAAETGAEKAVSGLVNGYINAIKRFPSVRTLAHMYDGLVPLRKYCFAPDSLGTDKCVCMLEPLMKVMAEHGVLWELYGDTVENEAVLLRASELGVRFCATADGHMLNGGWGPLDRHILAENLIDRLGLKRGTVDFG